jgi:hypothetical protein
MQPLAHRESDEGKCAHIRVGVAVVLGYRGCLAPRMPDLFTEGAVCRRGAQLTTRRFKEYDFVNRACELRSIGAPHGARHGF